MAKALSEDLRRRVVEAVEGGLTRRQAAERFGVSPSSAGRWHAQYRDTGSAAPRRQGGDRRSGRVEAEADFILGQVVAQPDITLAELREKLGERGSRFGAATLWRFFDRRRITLKKRPRTPASNSART